MVARGKNRLVESDEFYGPFDAMTLNIAIVTRPSIIRDGKPLKIRFKKGTRGK